MIEQFAADFLAREFLGLTVEAWVTLIAVWTGVSLTLVFLRKFLVLRMRRLAELTSTVVDDVLVSVLQKTKLYFLIALGLYIAVWIAPLTNAMATYISRVAFILLLIQVISWGNQLISDWILRYREQKLEVDAAAVTSMQAVGFIARLLLYTAIILIALDNFGIDVTALIAGLGVGGIAVALAIQNILGDLFASLSIVLDKPFVVGDFLIVDDYLGTVEQIGLKTTRLRSLSGEQIVFANSDLLNSRVRNYKRMFERRIVFAFGVVYTTSYEKLEAIPGIVRQIIESQDQVRFDRAHFKDYGDFSLNFEVVYFVLVADFNVYMDIQQAINLALLKAFEAESIDFAFPTQTLHFAPRDGDAGDRSEPWTR